MQIATQGKSKNTKTHTQSESNHFILCSFCLVGSQPGVCGILW